MIETIERLAIAIAVAVAVTGAVRDWTNDAPFVTANYYQETQTGGQIEAAYAAMGDYEVAYVEYPAEHFLVKTYEICYPAALAKDDGREWPIVVMSNGTGMAASRYMPVLEHLASWGFVVIGNEQQNSWSGEASSDSLDLLLRLNEDEGSIFYHKLDTSRVGSAGHSQGAIGAINAVTAQENGSYYTALYTASTPSSRYSATLNWDYDVSLIDIPYFMTAGTGLLDAGEVMTQEVTEQAQELSISPLWSQEENYSLVPDSIPKIRARRVGADHADVLPWGDGYMTAWFMYWLRGDAAAGEAFFGDSAEILSNPQWQDIEKNL